MKGGKNMGNNTADTSVVDAVPASDSAAKRLTGDERRREILDAVRTVSSELGVSHLSVSAVTKRAGCTRSLFYHYFADIEGALDTVAPLFKRLVASSHELPHTLTSNSGALYGGFLHNVVQRVAQYICDTTVVDFVAHHELRIDHVYETFYTLIMGLLMYIRTHPDVPDETVKEIIASTLHIEGYTAKYPERKPQN